MTNSTARRGIVGIALLLLFLVAVAVSVWLLGGLGDEADNADGRLAATVPQATESFENDEDIAELYAAIDGVQAGFCRVGSFDAAAPDNDLVLKCAANHLGITAADERRYIERAVIADAVTAVFGSGFSYTDADFYLYDTAVQGNAQLVFDSAAARYELVVGESTERQPFCEQLITGCTRSDSALELTVQMFYIKPQTITDGDEQLYTVYNDYDYSLDAYATRYADIRRSVFEDSILSDQSIDGIDNNAFYTLVNSSTLKSYRYRFTYNTADGRFVLNSFSQQ